jgi:hypothetical protein
MKDDPLDGVRLKLLRAWKQLGELKADMSLFLDSRPYRPTIQFNPKRQRLSVEVKVDRSVDKMWAVRIGEIVHNFRSPLDHIVWHLAGRPIAPGTKTQFPIFESPNGFKDRGIKQFLKNVNSKAIALIRSEQPFEGRDGQPPEGTRSPLWHLKELSDIDKHRTVHLAMGMLESYNFTPPAVEVPFQVIDLVERPAGPIEHDTEVWSARLVGASKWPFRPGNTNATLSLEVVFEERFPSSGLWSVYGTLAECGNKSERIISRIAKEILKTEL